MPEVNKTTVLKKVLRKSYSVDTNLLGKTKKPTGQPRKPLKSSGDEEQTTQKKTTKTRSKSVKGTQFHFRKRHNDAHVLFIVSEVDKYKSDMNYTY